MLNPDIQRALDQLPYDFVPIIPELAVLDQPVHHDQELGYSGEIWIEIKALTPLLVGNYRYEVKHIGQNNLHIKETVDENKTVLEPLRDDQGRVLIPGSSLTGMLRASISALLSAPMERVTERSYSYRVDARMAKPYYVSRMPFGQQQHYRIIPLKHIDIVWPRNREIETFIQRECVIKRARYVGGIDGTGKLAEAFAKQQNEKAARIYDWVGIKIRPDPKKETDLNTKIVQSYKWTQEHLADTQYGHISSRHPLMHDDPSLADQVKEDIENNSNLQIGQLVYAHVDQGQIKSIGHHFRYRQAYSSTVRTKFSLDRQTREVREELKPRPEELGEKPEQLSAARLLFGYIADQDEHSGTHGIGLKDDYSRLAGRLAFNFAVEQCQNPADDQRFYQNGQAIFLKVLGTPRPSAVECYLDQTQAQGKVLITYGDTFEEEGGELRGRKFYPHQLEVNEYPGHFIENDPEKKSSKLSTLARFISKKNTRFRCKLRFKNLRDWELGAVLVSLNPKLMLKMRQLPPAIQNKIQTNEFAHKLGYAQPLGLGSVEFKIQPKYFVEQRLYPIDESTQQRAIQALEEKMQSILRDERGQKMLIKWLDMHAKQNQRRHYPAKNGDIFEWHSQCRQQHLEAKFCR